MQTSGNGCVFTLATLQAANYRIYCPPQTNNNAKQALY